MTEVLLILFALIIWGLIRGKMESGGSSSPGNYPPRRPDHDTSFKQNDLVYLSDGRVGHVTQVGEDYYAVELHDSPSDFYENPGDMVFKPKDEVTKLL